MYNTEDKIIEISVEKYLHLYRNVDKFIVFCKQCGNYGNCWSCPPFSFDTEEYLAGYKTAIILGTKITNIDNLDINEVLIKERKRLDKMLLNMEEKHSGSRSFFAGVCHFCGSGKCSRIKGQPCLHADSVRPSLESLGFDIGRTSSELLGIDLKWGTEDKAPEYITLVSGFFTNDHIIIDHE